MTALPTPEKRRPLTRRQFAELIIRQACKCGCGCGKTLKADRIVDEHLHALDFLGSNDLKNRALWDRDCSKAKTSAEAPAFAKGRRLRGETGQRAKRERRGGSSIKGGGFPDKPDGYVSPLSKAARQATLKRIEARNA